MPKYESTNLVGASDMADRLGASPNTVNRWRQIHTDFPTPVLVVNDRTPVWNYPDVEKWMTKTGRDGAQVVREESPVTAPVEMVEVDTPTTKRDQERFAKLTTTERKRVLTRATELVASGSTPAQAWKQAWEVLAK